jgi:hypothetical protein
MAYHKQLCRMASLTRPCVESMLYLESAAHVSLLCYCCCTTLTQYGTDLACCMHDTDGRLNGVARAGRPTVRLCATHSLIRVERIMECGMDPYIKVEVPSTALGVRQQCPHTITCDSQKTSFALKGCYTSTECHWHCGDCMHNPYENTRCRHIVKACWYIMFTG